MAQQVVNNRFPENIGNRNPSPPDQQKINKVVK